MINVRSNLTITPTPTTKSTAALVDPSSVANDLNSDVQVLRAGRNTYHILNQTTKHHTNSSLAAADHQMAIVSPPSQALLLRPGPSPYPQFPPGHIVIMIAQSKDREIVDLRWLFLWSGLFDEVEFERELRMGAAR
ncbi:hypothetical protein BC937DRAFT_87560 [Endogone sp. FLAS-F59071]|nr:hypothetical protein BC937DRAFT_87560 [Endogone sp. FLAS-F59071]|eukprot:RUS19394.1 hypothetical protein BC937DRAFT_87560 [Endogone sp. FLAS-F59071]